MLAAFPTCLSSGCSERFGTACEITREGDTLRIESTGTVAHRGGSCTNDCQSLTAQCASQPLPAGVYTVAYGPHRGRVMLPTPGSGLFGTGPAGIFCSPLAAGAGGSGAGGSSAGGSGAGTGGGAAGTGGTTAGAGGSIAGAGGATAGAGGTTAGTGGTSTSDAGTNAPDGGRCAPRDARYTGGCDPASRFYWTGVGCVGRTGCECSGDDCDEGFATQEQCEAAFEGCADGTVLCGGWLGDTCGEAEYCAYVPELACGAADASSICQPRPRSCEDVYAPVCGCDNETYANACEAHAAGTGLAGYESCPQ